MKTTILTIATMLFLITTQAQQYKTIHDLPEQIKQRKAYQRALWFHNQRAYPYDTIPQHHYHQVMQQEINKAMSVQKQGNDFTFWTPIGPAGVQFTGYTSHWGVTSGRIRAVAVHPEDPLTVYIAAASGGIWKSTDGGDSWMDIGHELPALSYGAIAIDPENPETVYAGSGEALGLITQFGHFVGQGLFKSMDGGNSWQQITDGFGTQTHFTDIQVSPHNSDMVMATMGHGSGYLGLNMPNEGIWKSTDAGNNWTRTLEIQDVFDIIFHPSDPDIVYAAVGGMESNSGFYTSTDQGETWQQSNEGLQDAETISRIQIDISLSHHNVIYAVIYEPGEGFNDSKTRVYRTINDGQLWTRINNYGNLGGNYGSGWMDQGYYDLCIAIDPNSPYHVFVGNIELHETTDGDHFEPVRPYGNNAWKSIAHVDYHKLVFAPSDPDYLYIGCDGGLYMSDDGGETATHKNTGLSTLQFYRIAGHPENHDIIIGGMQDNCNTMTHDGGQTWNQVTLGDGMECFFDHTYPDSIVYATMQWGSLYKSTNGGASFTNIFQAHGAWIAPFFQHPDSNEWLYTANKNVYRSTNGGATFQSIANNVAPVIISDMAQSHVNPDNMILCTGFGDIPQYDTVILVKVSTDGGESWEDVSGNIQGEERWISRVKTDPYDENTMYIVRTGFSEENKIYRTTDLGQTWTNISGNLPDLPCNDLFIDPENTGYLYVANDIGVYLTTDVGLNWEYASEEIPFVPVFEFDYVDLPEGPYLRAGTYGRSIYEANLLYAGKEENPTQYSFAAIDVQNYPNPFNSSTTIEYEMAKNGDVSIQVYDQMGNKVDEINIPNMEKGNHQFTWQPDDLSPGVYYFKIVIKNDGVCGKMVKAY